MTSQLDDPWSQAQMHFRQGKFGIALTLCETILASQPHHSGAHLMLADLAIRADKRQLATENALASARKMGR